MVYPIFRDTNYGGYPAYDAGNENWPYAHFESYFYGAVWVMGAASVDDTQFRGSPIIADAILQAARELGYLGTPTPTSTGTASTSTPTSTETPTPTSTSTATTGISTHTPTSTPTRTITPCPMSFSDVSPDNPFYVDIRFLYCAGAISGYSDGTFRWGNNVTRAQVMKIVVLAFDFEIDTTGGPHFRDVPTDHPFYQYIETGYNNELISGYNCGPGCLEFRPYNNVTRGQICKIIVLVLDPPLYNPPEPTFRDVPPDHPFYVYVETLYHLYDCAAIIRGYDDGTFRPGNSATRGQVAKIVHLAVTARFNPCPTVTPTRPLPREP
jgi:hypothetical protein